MDPLNLAILAHDLTKVKLLLEEKNNPEIKDKAGRTPLINAVIENNLPIVKLLIHYCVNINAQDRIGFSALHYASQNQNIEITKFLIEKGSEIDIVDIYGNTPLGKAVFTSHGQGDVIQLLLDAGADKRKKNYHDISPMDLADSIGNYDVKRFFE